MKCNTREASAATGDEVMIGAGDEDRTRDIQLGKLTFYR